MENCYKFPGFPVDNAVMDGWHGSWEPRFESILVPRFSWNFGPSFSFWTKPWTRILVQKKVRGYFFREKAKKAVGASWSHRFFQSKKMTA